MYVTAAGLDASPQENRLAGLRTRQMKQQEVAPGSLECRAAKIVVGDDEHEARDHGQHGHHE